MNRCGSFSLLSAPHSLFSIWTNLKISQGHQRGRVDLASWALRTSPKFTTGVKYQFHHGIWPDQRSGNPNHPSPYIYIYTHSIFTHKACPDRPSCSSLQSSYVWFGYSSLRLQTNIREADSRVKCGLDHTRHATLLHCFFFILRNKTRCVLVMSKVENYKPRFPISSSAPWALASLLHSYITV